MWSPVLQVLCGWVHQGAAKSPLQGWQASRPLWRTPPRASGPTTCCLRRGGGPSPSQTHTSCVQPLRCTSTASPSLSATNLLSPGKFPKLSFAHVHRVSLRELPRVSVAPFAKPQQSHWQWRSTPTHRRSLLYFCRDVRALRHHCETSIT